MPMFEADVEKTLIEEDTIVIEAEDALDAEGKIYARLDAELSEDEDAIITRLEEVKD